MQLSEILNQPFIYFGTPKDNRETYYRNSLIDKTVASSLPRSVAVIRTIAYAIFGACGLFCQFSPFIRVPLISCFLVAGWTFYSHLWREDPLISLFYKMAGGKERYEKFPCNDEIIASGLDKIKWDNLTTPILRAHTKDGREVFIVKGKARDQEKNTIFVFVEKIRKGDLTTDLEEGTKVPFYKLKQALDSFLCALVYRKNLLRVQKFNKTNEDIIIQGKIKADVANEISCQLN